MRFAHSVLLGALVALPSLAGSPLFLNLRVSVPETLCPKPMVDLMREEIIAHALRAGFEVIEGEEGFPRLELSLESRAVGSHFFLSSLGILQADRDKEALNAGQMSELRDQRLLPAHLTTSAKALASHLCRKAGVLQTTSAPATAVPPLVFAAETSWDAQPEPVHRTFSTLQVKTQPTPPAYPTDAKSRRVQGDVVVEMVIDPDGRPTQALLLQGPTELAPTALAYAMEWEFHPALLNEKPQWARFKLTMPFRLAGGRLMTIPNSLPSSRPTVYYPGAQPINPANRFGR